MKTLHRSVESLVNNPNTSAIYGDLFENPQKLKRFLQINGISEQRIKKYLRFLELFESQ